MSIQVKQSIPNKITGVYIRNETEPRRINRIEFDILSRFIDRGFSIINYLVSLSKEWCHGLFYKFLTINWHIRLPSILLAYIIMLHLQQIFSF